MRRFTFITSAALVIGVLSGQELSGTWSLNLSRSDIRSLPTPPDPILKIQQRDRVLTVSGATNETGPLTTFEYPLDGSEKKQRVGESTWSTRTKWEGAALLVNTLVSGPQNYSIMERWRSSRDGSTLTIKRTIVRMAGETESMLIYENASVPKPAPSIPPNTPNQLSAPNQPSATPVPSEKNEPAPDSYSIQAGTRVLLSLTSAVHTRHSSPGDRIYLQTEAPIFSGRRVIIPRGSHVTGTVTDSKAAGRVKGKASLYLRFDSITLPNGVTRDLRSRVGSIDRDLDRKEGKITGEGGKGRDASTVGKTTAAGAGIGAMSGSAAGAGIGAAAGAAAGLIGVFGSRGPDVVLQPGTTMEMVLDRDLNFTAAELESLRR